MQLLFLINNEPLKYEKFINKSFRTNESSTQSITSAPEGQRRIQKHNVRICMASKQQLTIIYIFARDKWCEMPSIDTALFAWKLRGNCKEKNLSDNDGIVCRQPTAPSSSKLTIPSMLRKISNTVTTCMFSVSI